MNADERDQDDAERLRRFAQELRDVYRIKRFRSPEVTQVWLAEQVGRDQTTISNWLRGFREPSARDAIRLERAFKLPAGRLSHHLGFLPSDDEFGTPFIVATEDAISNDPYLDDPGRELLLAMYKTARERTLAGMRSFQQELDAETLRQIEEEAG